MNKLLSLLLLITTSIAIAQKDYTTIYDTDKIIDKGINLHDSGKYDEAIKEYKKISITDPKYLTAQFEIALSLSALDKDDELNNLFEKLYKNGSMAEFPGMYTLYGSFLSDQKKYDESEKIFLEGEKYLPNNSNLLYNFALLYVRKENRQMAVDILEKVITNDPNHSSSHYLLGIMAFENGSIVEGTLALMSYLVINPNGKYANDCIVKLDAKFGENYLTKGNLVFSKTGDNFEEIETILRNQLPLKSAYKVKSDFNEVIIRQVQAVAEYTLEHKSENGYFETIYMPWIKDMMQRNQFEGYSYYMLISLEEKLGKLLTSHKKEIIAFSDDYVSKNLWDQFAKRKLDVFGKQEEVVVIMKDNHPYLIGPIINGKRQGKQKLLNTDGNLNGEINFKDGELDGLQKYYNDKGVMIEERNYLNGKLDGTNSFYFDNGMLNLVKTYKDDKLNGLMTSYYVNGGKQCEVNFKNELREGKLICLYPNGTKKSETNYTDGKFNGPYLAYNESGDLIESSNYINDKLDGKYTKYYDGKTIKEEAIYSDGLVKDTFKTYYSNSILEDEYNYVNGKISNSKSYYATGKKSSESIYNAKGEIELVTYFDANENKFFEEKFKSGELKSGVQFLKSGNPVDISLSKKPYTIKSLNETIIVSGDFDKGKKINEWNYYFKTGLPRLKETYVNGHQNGIEKRYDRNGYLTAINNYVNDSLSGVYEVYDTDKLDRVYSYNKGIQTGPYQVFFTDGTTSSEGFLIDGEIINDRNVYWQNGNLLRKDKFIDDVITSTETYNPDGKLENKIDFKNKNGKSTETYYSGTIIRNYEFVNGEFNGKITEKDKLNTPISESEYINGVIHNNYKSYSPYGTISLERNYYNGKINGIEKYYDLVGNLKYTTEYIFGVENGKEIRYFHNKSKMAEFNNTDDLLEGDYTYFNQKGEPILKLNFQDNILKYYINLNKNGELLDKTEVLNGTANIESTYPNGKIAIKLNFIKSGLNGTFAIYNAEGKPEYLASYLKNIIDGERKEFYQNGNPYKIEHFTDGNYNGTQEYFQEDGKLIISANFKNDEMHGNTLIYKNGKLSITKKYDTDELVEIIQ